MADSEEVETVAATIAEAVGSQVFKPLHDTIEDMRIRDHYRDLAKQAIAVHQAETSRITNAWVARIKA